MPLTIMIDQQAGPCTGVKRVIRLSEESLSQGKPTASLGEVIHNKVEIERLKSLGLSDVNHTEFDRVVAGADPRRLVIPAHGAPMAVFDRAGDLDIELIDGTCPVVRRSQIYARKYYEAGYQVAIIGGPEHDEVIGIQGHCHNDILVVDNERDVARLDPDKPTYVLAQTTISDEKWHALIDAIQRRVADVTHRKTICAFVARRQDELRRFAATCDAVILVGGRDSSNTKAMVEVCRSVNPRTYWIETAEEVDPAQLQDVETIGVSGSASTPQWQIERTAQELARCYAARVAPNA